MMNSLARPSIPKMRNLRTHRSGTSLIEVLVVMVIFLIGILGIVQIFGPGFRVLSQTRDRSIASSLARDEMERIKGRSYQIPDMIVPVGYQWSGAAVVIVTDPDRKPNDLGPYAAALTVNGNLLDANGNILGLWPYLSGANLTRRIIGESSPVPAPRSLGSFVGGLMVLQFSPVIFNTQYSSLFQVYGSDMTQRDGAPFGRSRPWEFFTEDPDEAGGVIHVPVRTPADPTNQSYYRISMTAYVQTAGGVRQRSLNTVIDSAVLAADNVADSYLAQGFWSLSLAKLVPLASGETYLGADGIQLQKTFFRLGPSYAFTNDPYEYRMLEESMGLIVFNPVGYNYKERQRGGQLPLIARVDYDVLDWRVIKEDFRMTDVAPANYRLELGNLKALGKAEPDGRACTGLGVQVRNVSGALESRDVIIMDIETGGVLTYASNENPDDPNWNPNTVPQSSYTVDRSTGLIRFMDVNPSTPQVEVRVVVPNPFNVSQPYVTVVPLAGRSLRVMYMANGEWSVQAMKAASTYRPVIGRPGVGNFYVGTNGPIGGENVGVSATRIYFPWTDDGKNVVIREIWYRDGSGALQSLRDQDFTIQSTPADPLGLPYIDIQGYGANAFDFATYGYAVRGVRGASLTVRVLQNSATFTLTNSQATNLQRLEIWGRNWRRVTTETFLQRTEDN